MDYEAWLTHESDWRNYEREMKLVEVQKAAIKKAEAAKSTPTKLTEAHQAWEQELGALRMAPSNTKRDHCKGIEALNSAHNSVLGDKQIELREVNDKIKRRNVALEDLRQRVTHLEETVKDKDEIIKGKTEVIEVKD